jgi:hypothetical protein
MSDEDGARKDLDECLDTSGIVRDEYDRFLAAGCPIDCRVLPRCKPGNQLVDWRAMPLVAEIDGKNMGEIGLMIEHTGWQASTKKPWFQIARQALILEHLVKGIQTKKDKIEALKAFAALPSVNEKWNDTERRCAAFQNKKNCLALFRKYPVLLLQWGDDPKRTVLSYRQLLKHKTKMIEIMESDPAIAAFYKGECFNQQCY